MKVILSAGKQAQVFLFKGQADDVTSISEVGSPMTGTLKVWGLEVGNELKAVTTDGSEFASQVVTSTVEPLRLLPTAWRPRIEGYPTAEGKGLTLDVSQDVSQTEVISGPLHALLIEPGGIYSQTITMPGTDDGAYHGDLPFAFNDSAREGYLWVWGQSRDDKRLEMMTTYRIAGVPGSHEWAYPTTDLGSLDGLLRLNIPGYAVPTSTLIIVMPVYQVPPIGSGAAAARATDLRLAPKAKIAQGTGLRTPVGPAHSIRASGGITETAIPSVLTLFYTPEMGAGLEKANLSIYFYNDETHEWEDKEGVVDRENRSVSAPVNRFGIYALVKVFRSYLPIILSIR